MSIGINTDDTPINGSICFEIVEKLKKAEEERHRIILEAEERVHKAIEEFLSRDS